MSLLPQLMSPVIPLTYIRSYHFLSYLHHTISKSIDVANGTVNTCNTGTTVTIDASNGNTNLWVPITGPDGNIMAEISSWLNENMFEYLDAPVRRLSSADLPVPFNSELENIFLPQKNILEKIQEILAY